MNFSNLKGQRRNGGKCLWIFSRLSFEIFIKREKFKFTIGSIIEHEAELFIHKLINPVISMKPNRSLNQI